MATAGSLAATASIRPGLKHHILRRPLILLRHPQARHISTGYLKKTAASDEEFKEEALKIRKGEKPHVWDILKERGYVKDQTGEDAKFREIMLEKRIGAYVGVDPTAPSLHVGHLLPFMALFWLYIHGYGATTLVGGATAKVGDPIGRSQGRDPMARTDVAVNITKCHYQLKQLWLRVDERAKELGYQKKWGWRRALLNNSAWQNAVSFSEVVSQLFSGIRLGPMLSRETVKRRMDNDGMSLSEFVYPMMQAWDWWHLYASPKQTQMQIGGSDQYGNIIAGIEAIAHIRTNNAHKKDFPDTLLNTPLGFTVPLLTDSSGAKFGKSSGNAVWLDPFMTSPFDLYGYFMRRPDADVEALLKLLTFLPLPDIQKVMELHNQDPSKRPAQHLLAHQVLCLVHGKNEADSVQAQHHAVFAQRKQGIVLDPVFNEQVSFPTDGQPAHQDLASRFRIDIKLPEKLIKGKSIARILMASGLAASVSEGHRLCTAQGAYVAGKPGQSPSSESSMTNSGSLTFTPVKVWSPEDTQRYLIDDKILILRRGKHFIRVVEMVSDEEWAASGAHYPGEEGQGQLRRVREKLKLMGLSAKNESGKAVKFNQSEVANVADRVQQIELENESDLAEAAGGEPQIIFPVRSRASTFKKESKTAKNSKQTTQQQRSLDQDRLGLEEDVHEDQVLNETAEEKKRIIEEFLESERKGSSQAKQ